MATHRHPNGPGPGRPKDSKSWNKEAVRDIRERLGCDPIEGLIRVAQDLPNKKTVDAKIDAKSNRDRNVAFSLRSATYAESHPKTLQAQHLVAIALQLDSEAQDEAKAAGATKDESAELREAWEALIAAESARGRRRTAAAMRCW